MLKEGTFVRTMVVENPPTDWDEEAKKSRKFRIPGVVVRMGNDGHGDYVEVRHMDNSIGFYDKRELELLESQDSVLNQDFLTSLPLAEGLYLFLGVHSAREQFHPGYPELLRVYRNDKGELNYMGRDFWWQETLKQSVGVWVPINPTNEMLSKADSLIMDAKAREWAKNAVGKWWAKDSRTLKTWADLSSSSYDDNKNLSVVEHVVSLGLLIKIGEDTYQLKAA